MLGAESSSKFIDVRVVLLRRRLDLNAADSEGRTCVHVAASAGNLVAVKALAGMPGVVLSMQDAHGATPLSESIRCGHLGVARLLVECKAQLGMEEAAAAKQLLAHARSGEAEAVALLLCGGCDAGLADAEGRQTFESRAPPDAPSRVYCLQRLSSKPLVLRCAPPVAS
eukprot:5348546-Pleurochrysis_carterae.AAC.1